MYACLIIFHIDKAVKLVTGNHVNPYTNNWCIYVHRLNRKSETLAVRIEIHVWLYHNERCIMHHLLVRMPCLSGFFSDLYSNVVMLVQDCFLPQYIYVCVRVCIHQKQNYNCNQFVFGLIVLHPWMFSGPKLLHSTQSNI